MSENLDKQVDDLRAELAEAKVANEALKDKVVAEQHAEFSEKIQSLDTTIAEQAAKLAEQEEANKTLAESLKSQEETLAAKDEEIKAKSEELAVMKREEAKMKRRAQLEEIGFDAEEAAATVEEFDSLDDDMFTKVVARMPLKNAEWPPKKKKDEEDKEADAGNCACKAELDEEQDSAEASEEVLENVEEATEVAIAEAMGEEDPAENLRAVASEWLGSILKNKPQQ